MHACVPGAAPSTSQEQAEHMRYEQATHLEVLKRQQGPSDDKQRSTIWPQSAALQTGQESSRSCRKHEVCNTCPHTRRQKQCRQVSTGSRHTGQSSACCSAIFISQTCWVKNADAIPGVKWRGWVRLVGGILIYNITTFLYFGFLS